MGSRSRSQRPRCANRLPERELQPRHARLRAAAHLSRKKLRKLVEVEMLGCPRKLRKMQVILCAGSTVEERRFSAASIFKRGAGFRRRGRIPQKKQSATDPMS